MSGASNARLPNGTCLERYEIVRFLANGGFGDVYEARDTRLGRRVVVKSLRAEAAAEAETRTRFLREGRLAAAIEHPNVVRIFDVLEYDDGDAYLVMEFLEGHDLGDELSQRGPLPVEWLCDLMLPVCAAVAQVHARGILHRDIKPGNIYLSRSPDGEVIPKLLDFGISRPLDDHTGDLRTRTGTVLGSPRYMAPEQFEGKTRPDGRADVYALGAVLYRCLTGALPYQHVGDGPVELFTIISRIAGRELVAPRAWRPELPTAVEAIILRAMAPDRAQRFTDARELGLALVPYASLAARARWEPMLGRVARPSMEAPPAPATRINEGAPTMHLDLTTTSASVSSLHAATPGSAAGRPMQYWIAVAVAILMVASAAGIAVRLLRVPAQVTAPPPVLPPPVVPTVSRAQPPPQVPVERPAVPTAVPIPPSAPTPPPPSVAQDTPPTLPLERERTTRTRHGERGRGRHDSAGATVATQASVAPSGEAPVARTAAPTPSADAPTAPRRCENGADCAM